MMKKAVSYLFTLMTIFCFAFAFGGCSNEEIEVRGKYYTLEEAYENGWLSTEDLKSIACVYYDYWLIGEENPYKGMFISTEKLDKKTENELKQAYLNQIAKYPEGELDDVEINKCYGIYKENTIVDAWLKYTCIEPFPPIDKEIGGVEFKNYYPTKFWVYHI